MSARLRTLEASLGALFGLGKARPAKAAKRVADPAYARLRALVKSRGVTYRIARDGYIEFSDGVCFGHYGDWQETLAGYLEAEAA